MKPLNSLRKAAPKAGITITRKTREEVEKRISLILGICDEIDGLMDLAKAEIWQDCGPDARFDIAQKFFFQAIAWIDEATGEVDEQLTRLIKELDRVWIAFCGHYSEAARHFYALSGKPETEPMKNWVRCAFANLSRHKIQAKDRKTLAGFIGLGWGNAAQYLEPQVSIKEAGDGVEVMVLEIPDVIDLNVCPFTGKDRREVAA